MSSLLHHIKQNGPHYLLSDIICIMSTVCDHNIKIYSELPSWSRQTAPVLWPPGHLRYQQCETAWLWRVPLRAGSVSPKFELSPVASGIDEFTHKLVTRWTVWTRSVNCIGYKWEGGGTQEMARAHCSWNITDWTQMQTAWWPIIWRTQAQRINVSNDTAIRGG
jgi:hypothetical protein